MISNSPRSPGFTLIELLVVVAIIALLIAILLPSLGKARNQARTAACLASLHGIGIGSAAYTSDNDGCLAPSYIDLTFSNPHITVNGAVVLALQDILQPYIPQGGTNGNAALTSIHDKIWFCNSARLPSSVSGPQYPITYDANMGVHVRVTPTAPPSRYPPLMRLATVPRPAETIAIADASQNTAVMNSGPGFLDYTGTPWNASGSPGAAPGGDGGFDNQTQSQNIAANFPNGLWKDSIENSPYHIRARHNGDTAANALMVDGHAETFKHNTILYKNLSTTY